MKVIKYTYLSAVVNHGTEEAPEYENVFIGKTMPYTEDALEAAKREAYNGEYTIEEAPDEEAVPTIEQRVGALEESTAELDGVLTALLGGY